jgi:hypothetical protein
MAVWWGDYCTIKNRSIANDDYLADASRYCSVEKCPIKEATRRDRKNYAFKLAALGFMNCDRIGKIHK